METRNKGLILIAIILSIFIGTMPLLAAEATSGCPFNKEKKCMRSGDGPHGMGSGCQGMGKYHQGDPCSGCWKDLSAQDVEKVKNERTAFHKATQDLRQEKKSKKLALKSELMKKEPNADAAMALQAEISKLSSQLDSEQLNHFLNVKKIAPYANMKCLKWGKSDGSCMKKGGKNSPFCKQ
jgi:hypothetical protein